MYGFVLWLVFRRWSSFRGGRSSCRETGCKRMALDVLEPPSGHVRRVGSRRQDPGRSCTARARTGVLA